MVNSINFGSKFNKFESSANVNIPLSETIRSDLVRQPKVDEVNVSPKTISGAQKAALILGGAGALALGAIFAVKNSGKSSSYFEKAQKMFQQAFLRDDISIKETKEILKRYKEIEKIGDNEEYIKALYEQAIKDYRLGHLSFSLSVEDLKKGTLGAMNPAGVFTISKNAKRKDIKNIVFHEFRHAKQNDIMAATDMDRYVSGILNRANTEKTLKNSALYKDSLELLRKQGVDGEKYLLDFVKDHYKPQMIKKFQDSGYGKCEIPTGADFTDFVNKLFAGHESYVDTDGLLSLYKYHTNFLEKDARQIGEGMKKLLENIPDFE